MGIYREDHLYTVPFQLRNKILITSGTNGVRLFLQTFLWLYNFFPVNTCMENALKLILTLCEVFL